MEGICRKTDRFYRGIIKDLKMKRYLAAVLFAVMILPAQLTAQEYVNTPVEISKEKVKVDGKICYSHVVLEKQTLYSISKAYGVSIDDIYRFNPSTKENGLKKNSIIIIPSQEALAAPQPKEEPVKQAAVSEPVKAESPIKDNAKKAQRIHIAKWTEDLDVIAGMYGVSVEDIMKANNLKGRKLSKRQKLIIPFPGEEAEVAKETLIEEPVNETVEVATEEESQTAETEPVQTVESNAKNDINVTLILPLTGNDGTPNRNNLDFYCGSLLAAYDLGKEGINCRLSVYDIMDKLTQLSLETLDQSDVILGPISTADLTRMFTIAPQAKVIVSPLDPRTEKLAKEHGNMIQIPTPSFAQHQDLVSWIEEDFVEGDKVLMISEKGARLNNISAPLKQVLDSSSVIYSQFSYSILEGRDVSAPLMELMSTVGKNRVIIASESEAFVNDVIRNLNLLTRENLDITLYSTSKIRAFETIEVENLHNLTTHVSLNYYIDYNDVEVKEFLLKYRALYNTEPTQFAFQGYDIAKFCMSMCAKYGDEWMNRLDTTDAKMLQSILSLRKDAHHQGYTNKGVRRILYDRGYSVVTVR